LNRRNVEVRRSNRTALVFAAAALLMVVITVVLVFSWGRSPALMPENTPQGVVQRYLIALEQNDQARAAQYLGPPLSSDNSLKELPGFPPFLGAPSSYYAGPTWKASLGDVAATGNAATVRVIFEISTSPQAFGSQTFQNYITYQLSRNGNSWLIVSQAYSYP
jgi:hypothetical protein